MPPDHCLFTLLANMTCDSLGSLSIKSLFCRKKTKKQKKLGAFWFDRKNDGIQSNSWTVNVGQRGIV